MLRSLCPFALVKRNRLKCYLCRKLVSTGRLLCTFQCQARVFVSVASSMRDLCLLILLSQGTCLICKILVTSCYLSMHFVEFFNLTCDRSFFIFQRLSWPWWVRVRQFLARNVVAIVSSRISFWFLDNNSLFPWGWIVLTSQNRPVPWFFQFSHRTSISIFLESSLGQIELKIYCTECQSVLWCRNCSFFLLLSPASQSAWIVCLDLEP